MLFTCLLSTWVLSCRGEQLLKGNALLDIIASYFAGFIQLNKQDLSRQSLLLPRLRVLNWPRDVFNRSKYPKYPSVSARHWPISQCSVQWLSLVLRVHDCATILYEKARVITHSLHERLTHCPGKSNSSEKYRKTLFERERCLFSSEILLILDTKFQKAIVSEFSSGNRRCIIAFSVQIPCICRPYIISSRIKNPSFWPSFSPKKLLVTKFPWENLTWKRWCVYKIQNLHKKTTFLPCWLF